MENIIREYPLYRETKNYEDRYNKEDFEKYEEIKNSEIYDKWKSGINFATNRKISVGGKTHWLIKHKHLYITHKNWKHTNTSQIFFTDLDGIDCGMYLEETQKNKQAVDDYNLKAKEYNLLIKNVRNQINHLNKWEDYVEFEGLKYGIPAILENVHRENNCFGKIQEINEYTKCECHICENWGSCKYGSYSTRYLLCEKCGYRSYPATVNMSSYRPKDYM